MNRSFFGRALALCLLPLSMGCIIQIKGSGSWDPGSTRGHNLGSQSDAARPRLVGSGVLATEQRATDEFDALAIDDKFQIVVQVGASRQVQIEGDDNLLGSILTRVHGRTLEVRMEPGQFEFSQLPRLIISVPTLEDVELNGSSGIELTGLAGDDLSIVINAQAAVRATGFVDELQIEVNGTASLELFELIATELEIEINGVAAGKLHATERLEVDINGTGTLIYRGNPTTTFEINGTGQISAE